jgi:hypothetical protein
MIILRLDMEADNHLLPDRDVDYLKILLGADLKGEESSDEPQDS